MMLSQRAAWNTQKPSLCWGFPTKTRVFGTLARCAAPRRPGEKRGSHEARSATLAPARLLLRNRPFMARALAGHQKGRAALPDLGAAPGAGSACSSRIKHTSLNVANYIACFLTSHRKPSKCPCRIPFFWIWGWGGGMRMFWSKFVISPRTIMFSIA